MDGLVLGLLAQLLLAFGAAGLFWPERFVPVFDVLLFPWASSTRAVRAHSIAALIACFLLILKLLLR